MIYIKKIFLLLIILTLLSIIFIISYALKGSTFNLVKLDMYISYIEMKQKYLYKNKKCDNLTLKDTLILNESFKSIKMEGGLDYWCSIKKIKSYSSSSEKLTIPNIPPEIGKLKNLFEINISGTKIKGTLPKEIGNLKNLHILKFSKNELGGDIPKEIGNLNNLVVFSITMNNLIGNIPKELGNLKKIRSFLLYKNKLTGIIPKEIGELTNLVNFSTRNNNLDNKEIIEELLNLKNKGKLELLDF